MKFIFKKKQNDEKPAFSDVKLNQFFVWEGKLLQKMNDIEANLIADKNGMPRADADYNFRETDEIDRILPEVEKIEF